MKKEIIKYLLPPIITILIILITLMIKGIYPFGDMTIDYYDNMQQVAPIYNHLWDWLHGEENLFFDWYTGLGTNLSMTVSAFSMLSPFNLLLFFVPRSYIYQFFYILIIVKMAFMSETMYIYLNKKFKTDYVFKLLFSLMFAFSGYQMLYSITFMPWMDVIVFFPLIMLGLDNILKGKNNVLYIIILTLCLIINYYITALILLWVLILSGFYITFFVEKQERKKVICKLGISTFIAIGLAAFILVPTFMQLMNSQRFSYDTSGAGTVTILEKFNNILTAEKIDRDRVLEQYVIYSSLALPITIIISEITKNKENKKERKIVSILIALMFIPLIVEGTNLLLHFGSYVGYNMRYGFIISFVFLTIACYYCCKIEFSKEKIKYPVFISCILLFIIVFSLSIYCYELLEENLRMYEYMYKSMAYVFLFILVFIIFLIIYSLIFFKNNTVKKITLIFFVILEISLVVYSSLGRPEWKIYEHYQEGSYVEYANEAKKELNIEEDKINRIKNSDLSLNANYPLILRRAALSTYTAAIPDSLQKNCMKWGYSNFYLLILDSQGTIFSDALLNIKQAVNTMKLNEDLYELVDKTDRYYLYNSKYTLPFGLTVSSEILEKDTDNLNWIELNNLMYKELTEDDEELVEEILSKYQIINKTKKYTYNVDGKILSFNFEIKEKSILYFSSEQIMKIKVNGNEIKVPSIGQTNITVYPNKFNNKIIELGSFENETVKVEIETLDNNNFNIQMCLGLLNLEKMEKLCEEYKEYSVKEIANKNTLKFEVNGTEEKNVVLIPMAFDEGWKIKINGQDVEKNKISSVLGIYTAIEIEEGKNEITMKFIPKGLKTGIIISLSTVLICFILKKYKNIYQYLEKPALYIFYGVWGGTIILVYMVPIIYYIGIIFD